ncbi:MAG: aminodeoxychorismate synthase component I [Saprospiraceae bacterium]|nr:aminodeoxychorismate synthase component I [Saprospiraceae bacterium]MBK8484004.1 aminodeoxychorismate synthase component I [Saprospiraceae bacterium]MBK9221410.1 aminodeoxychorismate synthase component I [Saprospiraceae bacterium]MBK9721652.1 aminodeoxychorismate synthase component I [Saprospiraceae bacterium]MBK9728717.1 aminodeoxychorismate synthase component I [Saprospiraceae bacterium]
MNAYHLSNQAFVFAINFSKTTGFCLKPYEIPKDYIRFSMNFSEPGLALSKPLQFKIEPIQFIEYQAKFDRIQHQISDGNTYLCNLTQATKINTNLNLEEIYIYSKARHKLFLKDHIVVFSPETFITLNNDIIKTFPIKGTSTLEADPDGSILLNSSKENAEHNTIVDLMRNDLSIVSNHVTVDKLKTLDKIDTHQGAIWQMSSEISGILKPDYSRKAGDLFDKILPAGSISGAPKAKTLDIIHSTEAYDRGFYTGVFGYFDGINLTSSVMIRYIEKTTEGLVYKSGGGITSHSIAEQEYNELIKKVYVPIF